MTNCRAGTGISSVMSKQKIKLYPVSRGKALYWNPYNVKQLDVVMERKISKITSKSMLCYLFREAQ